jgi:hypothetical protein
MVQGCHMKKNHIDRLRDVVGTQARVAKALGMSVEHVSRMATGKYEVPDYVIAVTELLEALPRKDWPERWK